MGQFFTLPNFEFNNSKLVWVGPHPHHHHHQVQNFELWNSKLVCGVRAQGRAPHTPHPLHHHHNPQVQNFELIQNWFVGPSHHHPKFKIKKIKNFFFKIHTLLWPLVQGLWTFLKISQYLNIINIINIIIFLVKGKKVTKIGSLLKKRPNLVYGVSCTIFFQNIIKICKNLIQRKRA